MICGDRFIGRIDPKADRKNVVLSVNGIWLEPGVKQTVRLSARIEAAVRRLARFNGCRYQSD